MLFGARFAYGIKNKIFIQIGGKGQLKRFHVYHPKYLNSKILPFHVWHFVMGLPVDVKIRHNIFKSPSWSLATTTGLLLEFYQGDMKTGSFISQETNIPNDTATYFVIFNFLKKIVPTINPLT